MQADIAVLPGNPVSSGTPDLASPRISGAVPQLQRVVRNPSPAGVMSATVWVVDDEAPIRSLLTTVLEKASYTVAELADAAALKEKFGGPAPDVILLDLKLPDAEGLDLLPQVKKAFPSAEVIILTGFATIDAAVMATKLGAYDFQKKPFDHKSLLLQIERALEHKQLTEQTSSLRQALAAMSGGASPIFQSPSMKNIIRTVERVAPSDVSILITVESGS